MELDLQLVDEDPYQPRSEVNPGFRSASLAELATTIKQRGVKTPISVRANPQAPGRYIINHGARRYRASKLAGNLSIPAFVDNDYSDADQVIENLQRNELTPREIADYIGRELAKGLKRRDIAKSIGKSAAFVTQHVALLDLPVLIGEAFNMGRVRDVTVVNELVTCFKLNPEIVNSWIADETQDITRTTVRLLREFLQEKGEGSLLSARTDVAGQKTEQVPADNRPAEVVDARSIDARLKSPLVQVIYESRPARLNLHRIPSIVGFAWLDFDDDSTSQEVDLSLVRIVALTER